jgi:Holliday junction resolvase
MVKTYSKGAKAERELLHKLYTMGYAVIRAPRSGSISISVPDLVAIKDKKIYVFECKARGKCFTVAPEQLNELKEWQKRANAHAYIAWKYPHKGWFFIPLNKIKNRNVNKSHLEDAKTLEDF